MRVTKGNEQTTRSSQNRTTFTTDATMGNPEFPLLCWLYCSAINPNLITLQ